MNWFMRLFRAPVVHKIPTVIGVVPEAWRDHWRVTIIWRRPDGSTYTRFLSDWYGEARQYSSYSSASKTAWRERRRYDPYDAEVE